MDTSSNNFDTLSQATNKGLSTNNTNINSKMDFEQYDANTREITINDPNVPKPALRGAICKGNLYLNLTNIPPGDYSKELFITLLDKAEEAGCNNVIVCLDTKESIRPFGFLGFKILSPEHILVPKGCTKDMILMCYELEGTNKL